MKRLLSKTFVIGMAAALFLGFGATPAGAAADGGAVLTGTVSPDPIAQAAANVQGGGQPTDQLPVSVSMNGTAAGHVNGSPATCAISYNSSGTTNIATGSGTGNLTCSGSIVGGATFTVGCNVTYTQTGGLIQVSGGCSGSALVGTSLTATCGIQVATTTIAAECQFSIT